MGSAVVIRKAAVKKETTFVHIGQRPSLVPMCRNLKASYQKGLRAADVLGFLTEVEGWNY